jgi:exodeoxyribonuclease VIII
MNYYTTPAISASGLKLIKKSPAHFKAEKQEPTDAMKFGTETHCAVLEPHEFDNRYTVVPEGLDYRSNEGKEVRDAILAAGKEPIKYDEMQAIKAIQEAVHAHPMTKQLWSLAHSIEREHYFTLPCGTPAKMKTDFEIEPCSQFPNGLVLDLKTAQDASPDGFGASVWRGDMAIQAAFYTDNLQRIWSTAERPEFYWLPVEKKPPHLLKYYRLSDRVYQYGHDLVEELLQTYRDCLALDNWYGYGDDVADISLPGWTGLGDDSIEFSFNETEETEV